MRKVEPPLKIPAAKAETTGSEQTYPPDPTAGGDTVAEIGPSGGRQELRWARDDRMPRSRSQVLAGGAAQERNASAVENSLATRSEDGEARKDRESITTPRYWTT